MDVSVELADTSFEAPEDPIDVAISEYLAKNPDFPVSVTKLAPNYYVFGDRGQVYVTQRGEHIVVRVGGGYKSLQVFMDERALMVKEAAPAYTKPAEAPVSRPLEDMGRTSPVSLFSSQSSPASPPTQNYLSSQVVPVMA